MLKRTAGRTLAHDEADKDKQSALRPLGLLEEAENLSELYQEHVARQQYLLERLCERYGVTYILIASGTITYHFRDDREYPFKVNPYFKLWMPLTKHPDSYLLLAPGSKPKLLLYQPEDVWLVWPNMDCADWNVRSSIEEIYDVIKVKQIGDIRKILPREHSGLDQGAFIGPPQCLHVDWPISRINDDAIFAFLDFHRGYKSSYEINCIYRANLAAGAGHKSVVSALDEAGTEAEILWEYMQATRSTQLDSPYEPTIAFNRNCAILHYQFKSTVREKDVCSLLIDAGAEYAGYAADVCRTYSSHDNEFSNLIQQFDQLQQRLVSEALVGKTFGQLYDSACHAIAAFMAENRIITCGTEEAYEKGLVQYFFPHGLGHFLGLQVHDVGQCFSDELGTRARPIPRYPKHGDRSIEAGMVFTVEPGFYLIEEKINELRLSDFSTLINWNVVERLRPYGGIRIEDNILANNDAIVNLTRHAFKQVSMV